MFLAKKHNQLFIQILGKLIAVKKKNVLKVY